MVQKIYSKMYPILCTNTHHDVTDLVNHGMVKNTKTWISWKRNIIFLRNKKILNLCLRWYILRSYRFLAEVTFKGNPNFQGILDWILKILLYHSSKLHKNIETYSLLNKILLSLSTLLSVYCDLCFLCLSQQQMFFSSWTQYSAKFQTLQVIIRAVA